MPYYVDGIYAWLHQSTCSEEWHEKYRAWRAEHPKIPKPPTSVPIEQPDLEGLDELAREHAARSDSEKL